ncbi:hypothetical protein ACI7MJ_22090 [Aeromonas caviae]|uniref:hypothetical protein n=1 Tax=Aeromonas caviae TaxID=648 RepID=UPI00385ED131
MARKLDDILTTEMPDVVTQAREKADLMRLEIHLTQLREMLTQAGTEPMICDCIFRSKMNTYSGLK